SPCHLPAGAAWYKRPCFKERSLLARADDTAGCGAGELQRGLFQTFVHAGGQAAFPFLYSDGTNNVLRTP
ncbi:MAG: hypothetical protein M0Z27_01780, partial [Thermaerobacter sp.]|nr:hypothetical protein [Thermaerobacter sp.]